MVELRSKEMKPCGAVVGSSGCVCVCPCVSLESEQGEREREKPVATRIQQLSATEPPSIHKYSSNHISSDFES